VFVELTPTEDGIGAEGVDVTDQPFSAKYFGHVRLSWPTRKTPAQFYV